MKKQYIKPYLEIIEIEDDNIILTSAGSSSEDTPEGKHSWLDIIFGCGFWCPLYKNGTKSIIEENDYYDPFDDEPFEYHL